MTNEQILRGTQRLLMANYGRVPLAAVRAAGARLWDAAGREYIDLFAGFGAAGLGHCHPAVVAAIRRQAGELMCVGNLYQWQSQLELAEAVVRHAFEGRIFYCHSGAEANEAALKLARRAAGEGRYKIISFEDGFHGRTMGSLSLTAQTKFHASFEPMLPGCVYVPFGDLAAVEAAIDGQTAGVIVEPIQGEGGVNVPTVEFMRGLRRLCDEHRLTLICDEVWTAPARTGKWFAYQHYGMTPDVLTFGKACGGGVPVAGCLARGEKGLGEVLTPGTHGCTLGGNPVCAAAGAAVFRTIECEGLVEAAAERGRQIVEAIRGACLPCIREVRGEGLMLGVQVEGEAGAAKGLFKSCLDRGVLINVTAANVLRLAPPLVITDDELGKGLAVVIEALRKV